MKVYEEEGEYVFNIPAQALALHSKVRRSNEIVPYDNA